VNQSSAAKPYENGPSSLPMEEAEAAPLLALDSHQREGWSPHPPLAALMAKGRGASLLRPSLVFRVRFFVWCVIGVVGAAG
jgi:hypothetical protein